MDINQLQSVSAPLSPQLVEKKPFLKEFFRPTVSKIVLFLLTFILFPVKYNLGGFLLEQLSKPATSPLGFSIYSTVSALPTRISLILFPFFDSFKIDLSSVVFLVVLSAVLAFVFGYIADRKKIYLNCALVSFLILVYSIFILIGFDFLNWYIGIKLNLFIKIMASLIVFLVSLILSFLLGFLYSSDKINKKTLIIISLGLFFLIVSLFYYFFRTWLR